MNTVAKDLRTPRQKMWDAIRENLNDFTLEQVRAAANMKLDAARDYLTGLVKAGFCIKTHEQPFNTGSSLIAPQQAQAVYHYKLVRDCGNEAPRVTRAGKLVVDVGMKNEAMWRVLRICGAVTPRQLAALASNDVIVVSEETANTYLRFLCRAEYLTLVQDAKPNVRQAKYKLLNSKNTGAKPPQIQRTKRVFDPNVGSVVYSECPDDEFARDSATELEGYGHE